jgi:hypothetical protein
VGNPFDQFDNQQQTGPVYGLPLHPPQQTPDQAIGQGLQNQHTQLEIPGIPLQQANTRVNIAQGQASIASTNNQIRNTNLDNVNNLRKQFETEQSVQDYKTVLPLMDSALKIQNNKAGDLNLVYAFGKAMDPGSVVREGEQVMATNVGGVSEKVKGYIDQINGQGQLTPVQRTQLIEELRNRSRSLQETYNQRRAFYEDFANRNGINPNDVVGPHPGQPYQQDEAAYIQAHGGTPKIDGVPIARRTCCFRRWNAAGLRPHARSAPNLAHSRSDRCLQGVVEGAPRPEPGPAQLVPSFDGRSGQRGERDAIIASGKKGRISTDVEIKPDISDVRGGNNTAGTGSHQRNGARRSRHTFDGNDRQGRCRCRYPVQGRHDGREPSPANTPFPITTAEPPGFAHRRTGSRRRRSLPMGEMVRPADCAQKRGLPARPTGRALADRFQMCPRTRS